MTVPIDKTASLEEKFEKSRMIIAEQRKHIVNLENAAIYGHLGAHRNESSWDNGNDWVANTNEAVYDDFTTGLLYQGKKNILQYELAALGSSIALRMDQLQLIEQRYKAVLDELVQSKVNMLISDDSTVIKPVAQQTKIRTETMSADHAGNMDKSVHHHYHFAQPAAKLPDTAVMQSRWLTEPRRTFTKLRDVRTSRSSRSSALSASGVTAVTQGRVATCTPGSSKYAIPVCPPPSIQIKSETIECMI